MDFFNENFDCINKAASFGALEIAKITNCWELDDFRQEIFLFILQKQKFYDAKRGAPSTFVKVLIRTKKNLIIRKICTQKNKILKNAEELNEE